MSGFDSIEEIETYWFTMPDGVRLAARIWLPEGARENPVPAILEYIPYRRRDRTRARDESMHPHFAAAGYACVRVDIRGYGDSEGLVEDEYSHQEIQDGHDVVQLIAVQDWCDGNVGMFGKSWGAYNSFQVAATRPPALKAIAPVMGCDDRWREDIHFFGGNLANDNFWWGSIMQLYNAQPPDPDIVGWDKWEAIWKERLEETPFWPAMWLEHQTHDEMWRRGSICENYDDIQVPVYFFGGWADLFRDTPFRIAQYLNCPVKILMGPWAHLYPHEGSPEPKADFIDEMIRFMDHHLRGIDTGLMDEAPLKFYIPDAVRPSGTRAHRPGRWIEEEIWPSPNVSVSTYHLNDGTLDVSACEAAPMSVCSPQTFGSVGGDMCSFAVPGDIPGDCRIDAHGAMLFRSAPLETAIDILGQPEISLRVASDRAQAFVAALLIDEAPDGAQTLITRGFCNLNHRNSDMQPQDLVPGEEVAVTVPLHGIAYRLPAGHRVMVQLASAYWPILWPKPEPVTLTVTPGRSHLSLPIRNASASEMDQSRFPSPPDRTPAKPTKTSSGGTMFRNQTRDMMTGVQTEHTYIDGGVFGPVGASTILETGTTLHDISERKYAIHPDDPLSAKATMEQSLRLERGNWKVLIKTCSEQTATRTHFHLKDRLECWNGDTLFYSRERTHKIPRDGM